MMKIAARSAVTDVSPDYKTPDVWKASISPNGKRGEIWGPDGRYRGAMSADKARALVEELNDIDPRVKR